MLNVNGSIYMRGQALLTRTSTDAIYFPLNGRVDGSSPSAGQVGEYLSASLAQGSAVALTTGVAANVVSLSLTPGLWEVSGLVAYHNNATTVMSDAEQGTSVTSATLGPLGSYTYDLVGLASAEDLFYVTPTQKINVSVTTTVYLVSKVDFTVSTAAAYGFIQAWRRA